MGSPTQTYDAILFDFDGVLADTEPLHWSTWAEAVRPLGIELDWPTYQRHCVGVTDLDLIGFMADRATPPLDHAILEARYPDKQALFRQRMASHPPFLPDVIDLVQSLTDYRLAIVTSSNSAEIRPALAAAGILDSFAAIITPAEVARTKPAPDPYLKAAERLGASNPLVVEDSDPGCASGRAAGFDVLRIPEPSQMAALLRGALHFR